MIGSMVVAGPILAMERTMANERHAWPTKIVKAKIVVLGLDSASASQ
jgi:hypothetical protein